MVINKIEWRDSVDRRGSTGWKFQPDFFGEKCNLRKKLLSERKNRKSI